MAPTQADNTEHPTQSSHDEEAPSSPTKHISFPAHGPAVITRLILSNGRVISASDDHEILVHSLESGQLIHSLQGHQGGIWSIEVYKDALVSGSTDRTIRIWDLLTGRCLHIFGGHTSTVRAIAIVKPELVSIEREDGVSVKEKWPKRPMIVSGSRDHSLRVWTLPRPDEVVFNCFGTNEAEPDQDEVHGIEENPYHHKHLQGHHHAVRDLAARGRTIVSGSYDTSVRIWDLVTGECKHTLSGHTQKVYSVVLDPGRSRVYSGSMDGTVRVWDTQTGECIHTLEGHTSLVGLLNVSPTYLVSAAADSTVRIWDPTTGDLLHVLSAHTGAITAFQHDDLKLVSGGDGALILWDVQEGTLIDQLLADVSGVWQVVFEGRWCAAASNRLDNTMIDVWDFGESSNPSWPRDKVKEQAEADGESIEED